ncbi:Enhancer of polycomb-like [Musa troglodytarum]|uniref:Enhancer of polycomb-like protein n=1 Tax=Musa troglodytarum TaxID=320322 RepID=A0A9E7KLL6_9LILI|nr:Enhancer of polycomb-like [Musa troglodytarum]
MEISFERAETSDIPTKPGSLDLQSIYVKKSRSSDRKSWAGKEVLVLEQESRVFNRNLGSAFEEGGEFLSESRRKPSRKEASVGSLEPGSKRQRNSLNVSRPKKNYISYAQKRDKTTNAGDATLNLDWSSGNEQYLETDLYSQLSKKTDHTSSSGGTSKNENYLGEDLVIPKRPRGIFKWKKAKDPISLGIPVGNSNHEWINTDTQDQKSSISVNLNSPVLNDKQKKKTDDFELNGFNKDDSAPCTSVENDSHFDDDDRKVGSRRKLKMSEQNCTGNDAPLIDNSEDSVGDSLDDDEENLEENAARMLSSRFDPNCTGFSGKRTCAADPVEGSSFLQSAGGRLKVLQAESRSVDAKGRVLRPRRHNGKSFARKRRHFYEVCSRDMDPYCVVKQRIRVFWPLDKSWYFGLVKGYDPVTRLHHVKYDDRDEEWINLQKERFKLLLFPSEVSSKFNFGKPGSQVRQKKIEKKVEATQSTYIGNVLESEPIISWLTHATRQVTSSSSSTIKKHLRVRPLKDIRPSVLSEPRENMLVNPLDKNLNKLFSNFNESAQACDWNINRISKLKRSIDCEGRKLPYVYFRKRFRSRKDILDTKVVHNVAPDGPGGSMTICASIANSTTATERLNIILTWLEFGEVIFESSLPPQCSLALAFQKESIWLCQSLYILHHGQLVCAWPTVHMEVFYIDNVLGLKFLLFEGCLRRAVSLFCLIITTVNGHIVKSNFTEPEVSCSSIGLRISTLHNLGVKLLFVLNTFFNMESLKWRHLEDKLKKHCTKEALVTTEYTCSNIHELPASQIVHSSLERFWGRSNLVHRSNPEKLVDTSTNSVIHYLAQEHEKPLLCSQFFAAGPSFSLSLHLKLLVVKDPSSFCSEDYILVSSEKHTDNNDKLIADGCSSADDPSKQAAEMLDTSGPLLNQAAGSHGRPSTDALSAENDGGSGNGVKSTGDVGAIQFGRFSCKAGTSQVAEVSCSEYPEGSSPDKSLDGGCNSCINTENLKAQLFDEVEKHSLHKGLLIAHPASNLVLEMNEHTIQNPTGPRSMWHRNRHTSLSRTFIHPPKFSSEDLVANGPTSRCRRRRTQVSYSQLSVGYQNNHQKVQPHRKVKTLLANISSDCSRSPQNYLDSVDCAANVLVTHGDKCWREYGAKVQLDCDDQKNWRICVMVSGVTKYVYNAHHVLQPGSTNRYTHAMMWKGGKEWMLEFTDRNQWYIFKQMHEKCYNQNIRAASIKNIPIPGVHMLSDGDDGYVEVPFVRGSSKYFRQMGTEVDLALDPSRVLYDVDSEDEKWICTVRVTMDAMDSKMPEVTEDMFEKVIDMFEKVAYTLQSEEFTNDDIERYMADVGPADVIKVIYEYWRLKRKKKGLPLIRQFQPPLWECYQQQLKEWESSMNKMPIQPEGCQDKASSQKKPPIFAFCLRPRGLEIPNKGSKQRSHKKLMFTGHHNALMRDQDGFHTFGRKTDGVSVGEVAISSYESSDSYHGLQYRSTFSPRDTASTESLYTNDGSERYPEPKFYRNISKKIDAFLSPRDPQETPLSYNQRSNRNGINKRSYEFCEWSSTKQSQCAGCQRHPTDMDEFRLRDATTAAQHALNMARLKREKAQWLLHKADLALHRATVAIMTAEAIKASEKDTVGDG